MLGVTTVLGNANIIILSPICDVRANKRKLLKTYFAPLCRLLSAVSPVYLCPAFFVASISNLLIITDRVNDSKPTPTYRRLDNTNPDVGGQLVRGRFVHSQLAAVS